MITLTDMHHLLDFSMGYDKHTDLTLFASYPKSVLSAENEARIFPEFEQQLIEEQYFPFKPKLFREPGITDMTENIFSSEPCSLNQPQNTAELQ